MRPQPAPSRWPLTLTFALGAVVLACSAWWATGASMNGVSKPWQFTSGDAGNPAAQHPDYQRMPVADPSPVDIGFVQSMHAHHAQAVQLAMLVRHRTASPDIKRLADSIVLAQSGEMGLMKGWLTAWGAPILQTGPAMDWVERAQPYRTVNDALYASRCRATQGQMPGQASAQDIRALSVAEGAELDRHFLRLMLAHHQAALEMADFVQRHAATDLVINFAGTLIREQYKEIGWIHNRLQS